MIPGAIAWTIAAALLRSSPLDLEWARSMLVFAALVLVPLGSSLAPCGCRPPPLLLAAGLLLGAAQFTEPGLLAAGLALPWLGACTALAWQGLQDQRARGRSLSVASCFGIARVYLLVGAAWAVCDRVGYRPLGFDPVIVLLTAIHFHYAGFVLPVATGLALQRARGSVTPPAVGAGRAAVIGGAVVAGIPAVAVGITASQLGLPPLLECLAAWFLALAACAVAWLHLDLARRPDVALAVRIAWALAGASLFFSMVLAALYGSRAFLALEWLDIPWMRALHGSANAFGFALLSLLGWLCAKTLNPRVFPSIRARSGPDNK